MGLVRDETLSPSLFGIVCLEKYKITMRQAGLSWWDPLTFTISWTFLREAIIRQIKDFLWFFSLTLGGSYWFHTSIYFSLQHPSNTLKTPLNSLETPFKIISLFLLKKWAGKKRMMASLKNRRYWRLTYICIRQYLFVSIRHILYAMYMYEENFALSLS